MHREILDAPSGQVVDHKNANGVDNRKANLRFASIGQNTRYQRRQRRNTSSQFKGVYYRKDRGKWTAYINKDGKRRVLGCFASEREAAVAYDTAATQLHGKFALTNEAMGLL